MKKLSFILLTLSCFAFTACVDKNVKAEKEAFSVLSEADLDGIREYKTNFANYISDEHMRVADSLYSELIADSTMFASIQAMPEDKLLAKYNKMNEYLEKYPNGLNSFEANEFIHENRDEIERIQKLHKQFNDIVNRYDFYNQNSSGYTFTFITLSPVSENGMGRIDAYARDSIFDDWEKMSNFKEYRLYEVGYLYSIIEIIFPSYSIEARVSDSSLSFSDRGSSYRFDARLKSEELTKTIISSSKKSN